MLQSSADECNAMHKAGGYTHMLFFIIFLYIYIDQLGVKEINAYSSWLDLQTKSQLMNKLNTRVKLKKT